MRTRSIIKTTAVFVGLLGAFAFTTGCNFNPLKFAGRNACEILNCDVLFFVDDILPLAGGPVGEGGGGAEEGGGH